MNSNKIRTLLSASIAGLMIAASPFVSAQTSILNVSYDVAR